jgi:hypothetical protein
MQEDSKAGLAQEIIAKLREAAAVKIHLPPAPAPTPSAIPGMPQQEGAALPSQ